MSTSSLTETIETGKANKFFDIQRPFIQLMEDYLMLHPVDGKKMSIKTFCEQSGLSIWTITSIMNGSRWVAQCERSTVNRLASTLRIAVVQVYFLSGFFTTSDTVSPKDLDQTLTEIYAKMAQDKRMTHLAPSKTAWDTWPQDAKLSICMMYEELTDQILLQYAEIFASDDPTVANRYDAQHLSN